jgi:hypothetical protein
VHSSQFFHLTVRHCVGDNHGGCIGDSFGADGEDVSGGAVERESSFYNFCSQLLI